MTWQQRQELLGVAVTAPQDPLQQLSIDPREERRRGVRGGAQGQRVVDPQEDPPPQQSRLPVRGGAGMGGMLEERGTKGAEEVRALEQKQRAKRGTWVGSQGQETLQEGRQVIAPAEGGEGKRGQGEGT
jgi:hypothetical protein